MVTMRRPSLAEFFLNDDVCLRDQHRDIPPGTVGRILGKIPHPVGTTYVVCFIAEKLSVLEVFSNEIVPAPTN